jgi:hypothetical protein
MKQILGNQNVTIWLQCEIFCSLDIRITDEHSQLGIIHLYGTCICPRVHMHVYFCEYVGYIHWYSYSGIKTRKV